MSAPKHTPGPWKIGAYESGQMAVDGANGEEVTGFISPEDACLIAAAPELLEALQGMLVEKPIDELLAFARAAREMARAVGAKALAHAWTVASPANREVLELAFAGLFAPYKEDATK
ncbi:MAG: hypothetical protein ACK5X3_21605 [Pseudomonadota bacterium]